jgi:hypothetical protein
MGFVEAVVEIVGAALGSDQVLDHMMRPSVALVSFVVEVQDFGVEEEAASLVVQKQVPYWTSECLVDSSLTMAVVVMNSSLKHYTKMAALQYYWIQAVVVVVRPICVFDP